MGLNTIPANTWPLSSEKVGSGGGGSQYELPIAGSETLGGVKVGTGLSINAETGVLSNSNPTPYSLPIAGAETLGGVKVGTGLTIDAETGVLSNDNPTPYTPQAYSTTEHDTGKRWIDGRSIYEKTIDCGALPNTTTKTVDHNVSDIDFIINRTGVAYNDEKSTMFVLPHIAMTSGYSIELSANASVIAIGTGVDRSSITNCFVTLEYVKTAQEG